MNPVSQDNRRIHSRRDVKVAARLVHVDGSVEGVIENLGAGGVFFATENLELVAEDDSAVTLSFHGKKGGVDVDLTRKGTVLRTELHFDGETVKRTFAIRFDEVAPLDGVEFA
jgi:hypothetical protein